jgi:hypothetical protein
MPFVTLHKSIAPKGRSYKGRVESGTMPIRFRIATT